LTDFVTGVWWTRYANQKLARKTCANYADHYRRWVEPHPLGDTAISKITAEKITNWQDWCREHGATDAVIAVALKPIAGALRWAAARGDTYRLASNPMREVEWPSQARSKEPYVFSPRIVEQVRRRILASSSERPARDALLLSLQALTGARSPRWRFALPTSGPRTSRCEQPSPGASAGRRCGRRCVTRSKR